MRKGLLFLALFLPVLIFLFLHFFGKNEFDVPVLFQSAEELSGDCKVDYTLPYKVKSDQVGVAGGAVVLFSSGLTSEKFDDALFQLSRLKDEFGKDAPQVVIIKKGSDGFPQVQHEVTLNKQDYDYERKCIFLAGDNRMVLVDNESHIRGLYADVSLEEMDRLILELKIIFKQY